MAGIGTRSEPDVVRRIVAEVTGIVDRREAYFRAHGIDSIETYRSRRVLGRADDGYGDVFLVVDGWGTLRADFDDLELELQQLASRGLTFGLHVVTASSRWADYRAAVRDLLGTRLELRLGDPMDSEVDREAGRAWCRPGAPVAVWCRAGSTSWSALPRIDGDADVATLGDGVETWSKRVSEAWTGPPAPGCGCSPERIGGRGPAGAGRRSRPARAGGCCSVSTRRSWRRSALDPDTEPHWLIFGDGRSGKSAALRSYVHEVMRTRTPQQAQLVVVDYRRSLLGEVPEEYLLDYLTSAAQATPTLADLASYLENRIPGPGRDARAAAEPVVVDRGRRCSSWSTTTTWSRRPRARRCRRSSRCSPRPATSGSTWSWRGGREVRRGRCTSRSSSHCATWRCRDSSSPAAPTRVR